MPEKETIILISGFEKLLVGQFTPTKCRLAKNSIITIDIGIAYK